MSIDKIDEPDLQPEDQFDTVRRGFARDQVAAYLKWVTTSVLTLEKRLEDTRTELFEARRERDAALAQVASSRRDPYEDVSGRVIELVRSFDREVGQLEREAEAEADRVVSDLRTGADRILAQAHEDAERIKAEARKEAEHIITQAQDKAILAESDLTTARESTFDTIRAINTRALAALEEVQAELDSWAESDRVVVVNEAEETAAPQMPSIPRPDM